MRVENKRTYKGPGVYIGRPSPWGNPFTPGKSKYMEVIPVNTRDEAVAAFDWYARARLKREPKWLDPLRGVPAVICWCAPLACHGDILVRLIEELDNQPANR